MDNTTIYEFLQEKSVIPTGPGSYSDSTEMSNALKVFKKNSSSKTKWKKDVNFYDYDGSLVDSYSTEEFLQLSAMPAKPSHNGLTAQGWNYTLADAKNYVENYRKLDIGQMYVSTETESDGKTRIYIHLEDGRLSPMLGIGLNGTCDVDWGDGTDHSTMTGDSLSTLVTSTHIYSTAGDYIITIDVTGKFAFIGTKDNGSQLLTKNGNATNEARVYENSIVGLKIGSNITSIGDYAFQNCYALTSVTISSSVTSIGEFAFSGCYALTSITIPSSVTSIDTYVFQDCHALTSITIPSNVTSIGIYTFQNCYSLTSITIPSNVTSIGTYAFNGCYSLTSITIPSSVTSIGSKAFLDCYSLTSITIPSSVTSINSSTFSGCRSLTSITIPSSVTSIGTFAFGGCYSLTSITIPSSVTSINSSAFSVCYSLTSITIPSSVTSIDNDAFDYCYGLGFIKFESSTPATVSNANAWSNIPTDCIIYVPQDSLSAYKSASNYPDSSTYTYVEY